MMVLDNEFNTYFNLKKIRRLSKSLDVAGRQAGRFSNANLFFVNYCPIIYLKSSTLFSSSTGIEFDSFVGKA